jgi:hypothetical protein
MIQQFDIAILVAVAVAVAVVLAVAVVVAVAVAVFLVAVRCHLHPFTRQDSISIPFYQTAVLSPAPVLQVADWLICGSC